jgi:HEAT repeat protein
LGKLKAQQAVETLIPLLKDGDTSTAAAAAEALGMIADRRAIEPLINAFSRSDASSTAALFGSRVRPRIASALEKITGQRLGDNPESWKQWWQKQSPQTPKN